MYDWKITLVNGKEYIVESNISTADDFFKDCVGLQNDRVSILDCSKIDTNGCRTVTIIGKYVCSIEILKQSFGKDKYDEQIRFCNRPKISNG